MKVCSECRKCYDDSIVNCDFEDHGVLKAARVGERTLVEGYEINAQIESDSPVELFRATHSASEKSVIFRIIKDDDSSVELRDELQSYANINHSSLARVFEFGKFGNEEIYIVSEDLEGQTLREYLAESKNFDEKQSIEIALQIADGLEKLHDAEILHRSINPANVYITSAGENPFKVKLNYPDFAGIIEKKVVKDANAINAKTSIFEYYSPEQFSNNEIDYKSDLYSLAIVFYEMLVGRTPYDLLSPQAIKNFVFNEDDVDCLNHDLRGLITYTLRESLQQKMSLRPRSTNNVVKQLRHLELVATPSETSEIVDDTPIEPKLAEKTSDRERIIEELKQSINHPNIIFDDNNAENQNLTLSAHEQNSDENYLTIDNLDEVGEQETKHLGFIDELESIEENEFEHLQISENKPNVPRVNTQANSYTFRKSHVYIAGAFVMFLFGSFFLVNFCNWQNSALSTKTSKSEKQKNAKKAEQPNEVSNDEITESKSGELSDTDNEISLDMNSRDVFLQERGENTDAIKTKKALENIETGKTEKTKSIKKSRITTKPTIDNSAENKLFADKIIIVGDKQKNASEQIKNGNNTDTKKRSKVFSDVVITY